MQLQKKLLRMEMGQISLFHLHGSFVAKHGDLIFLFLRRTLYFLQFFSNIFFDLHDQLFTLTAIELNQLFIPCFVLCDERGDHAVYFSEVHATTFLSVSIDAVRTHPVSLRATM